MTIMKPFREADNMFERVGDTMNNNRFFTVSEAARELGRSAEWLRNAETNGKIPKARRDINGWRVYNKEDLDRLKRLIVPGMKNGSGVNQCY